MAKDAFLGIVESFVQGLTPRKATGQVGHGHSMAAPRVLVYHYCISHRRVLQSHPACRKMLRSVPMGMSLLVYGTVTTPCE